MGKKEETMEAIDVYLTKNLNKPAERILVIELINRLLEENVKTKFVSMTPEVYFCPSCNEWITEDDINTVEVFKQTLEEPAEYESFCKCGATAEDFEEMTLDADELCETLNELKFRL